MKLCHQCSYLKNGLTLRIWVCVWFVNNRMTWLNVFRAWMTVLALEEWLAPFSTNYIVWIFFMFSRALGFLTLCLENDLWGKHLCTDLAWRLGNHKWYVDVKVYNTSHLYNLIYLNNSMTFPSIIELNLLIFLCKMGSVHLLFILWLDDGVMMIWTAFLGWTRSYIHALHP